MEETVGTSGSTPLQEGGVEKQPLLSVLPGGCAMHHGLVLQEVFLRAVSILREGTACLCLQGLFFVKTKQTNETTPLNFRETKHNRKFKRQAVNYPSDCAIPSTQVHGHLRRNAAPDRSSTVAVCFQPGVARALRTSCARSSLIRSSIGLLSSLRTSSLLLALLLSDPSRQIPLLISYPNSPCLGHSPLCMAPTMLCGFHTYLH